MGVAELEVAVCGSGPAGLATALFLHKIGHRVRLFERFDSARPLGSGLILQPTGLAVLSELGAIDEIQQLGARIDRLFGRVVPSQRAVLDVRYAALGRGWHGIAVHRSTLFQVLQQRVQSSGLTSTYGVPISTVRREGNQSFILLTDENQRFGPFDLVVDAMGANSPLTAQLTRRLLPYGALWATVPWPSGGEFLDNALEQRYRRAQQMAGVMPVGRLDANGLPLAAFFWSLKREALDGWRSSSLDSWKSEVMQLWPQAEPLLAHISEHATMTFARYDHFTRSRPYAPGLAHVGDSSRATSPQLGQGANMALLDALALSTALKQSATLEEALQSYGRMRRWHTRIFQWASATFTPFYQSDSNTLPWARDWLASPLSRVPVLSRVLARLVSGSLTRPLGRKVSFRAFRSDA
jgi:salicylate hydroxylase